MGFINKACTVAAAGVCVFAVVNMGGNKSQDIPPDDNDDVEVNTAAGGGGDSPATNPGDPNQPHTGTAGPGSGDQPWMDTAGKYIGTQESGENRGAQVDAWNQENGGALGDPWCASFVNATLAENGIQGTGSASSQSFKNWGTDAGGPVTGAIVVFRNSDGRTGHVGYVQSVNSNGTINVLGGNQNQGVNVATFNTKKVVAYRLPPGHSGGGTQQGNGGTTTPTNTR